MKPLSVGALAKHCGVSRTALLNYEALGLLAPARSPAGYRVYDALAVARVERICAFRATGLGLAAIAALLREDASSSPIEQRLHAIHQEMAQLREQQAVLIRLLSAEPPADMNKARWTALLRASGMDDAAMRRWHAVFEQQDPKAHTGFLLALGIEAKEVTAIRAWSRRQAVR